MLSQQERRKSVRIREGVGPLAGLRVLDAGTMIGGPLAATLLGDLGAEVIKIEKPFSGDPMRNWEPLKDGKSLWWKVLSRNKRLITLDLRKAEGRNLLLRLAAKADVLVENFRPGTLDRWGLSADTLLNTNPRLVIVRVSGYGQKGPLASKPGYGTIAEAMSGIPYMTGLPEGPPLLPPFPLADSVAATFGALGAMSALWERERSGKGQEVDVSLFEPLFRLADSLSIGYDQLGIVKRRMGNQLAEDAPRNLYRTADNRWLAISASSNRTFARLTEAIGQPGLADDPRFHSNAARVRNVEELDAILAEWFVARTLHDALERLDRYDVICGPVLSIEDIFSNKQYRALGSIVAVRDEDFGTVRMANVVPRFSRTPPHLVSTGGELGMSNRAVFVDDLGLESEQIAYLENHRII